MTLRVLLKSRGDVRLTHLTYLGLNDLPVGGSFEVFDDDPVIYPDKRSALRAFVVAARRRGLAAANQSEV